MEPGDLLNRRLPCSFVKTNAEMWKPESKESMMAVPRETTRKTPHQTEELRREISKEKQTEMLKLGAGLVAQC